MFTNSPFCSLNYLIAHHNVPFCVHNLPKMFIQTHYVAPHGVSYILLPPPHQITTMTFGWKPQTNVMILTPEHDNPPHGAEDPHDCAMPARDSSPEPRLTTNTVHGQNAYYEQTTSFAPPSPECLMVKELVGGALLHINGIVEYSDYRYLT